MPNILDFNHIPVNYPVDDSIVTCSELPVPLPLAVQPISSPRLIDELVKRDLDLPLGSRRHLTNIPQGPPGETDFAHPRPAGLPPEGSGPIGSGGSPKTGS